jgi:hypothetical protein
MNRKWKEEKETKPNGKLIFTHTPKCGGTYTIQILQYFNIINKGHKLATHEESENHITFTVIRHPVNRFESFMNYRLSELKPRKDWLKKLKYIYDDKTICLNQIVSKFNDQQLTMFKEYRTLEFWSKNINVFITVDQLHDFLSYFGYHYDLTKFPKQNVSKKTRGKFNEFTKQRIARIFENDIILFDNVLSSKILCDM